MSSKRYLDNCLSPISPDQNTEALARLRNAIRESVAHLNRHYDLGVEANCRNSPYNGSPGVAAMYLRLQFHSEAVQLPPELTASFDQTIINFLPLVKEAQFHFTALSPLESESGAAVLELMRQLQPTHWSAAFSEERWTTALDILRNNVRVALEKDRDILYGGGCEALYGRTGLLWALINLRKLCDCYVDTGSKEGITNGVPTEKVQGLMDTVKDENLRELVNMIVESGKVGVKVYEKHYGEPPATMPLMWHWYGQFYLGLVHGSAAILTILLQMPQHILADHLSLLLETSNSLLSIVVAEEGHLPTSAPFKHGTTDLVQICHGSPGALFLLATLRKFYPSHEEVVKGLWAKAEQVASDVVWKEGLLKKGVNICHGVTGNAWGWILLAQYNKSSNHLSRALAFLLHAPDLPPLALSGKADERYKLPDNPLSLFEGLAGAVCVWTDACALLTQTKDAKLLGVPGVGGLGGWGLL